VIRNEEADKKFLEKKQIIKDLIKYNSYEFIEHGYEKQFDDIFRDERIFANKAIG
jgi:hypothetical protein